MKFCVSKTYKGNALHFRLYLENWTLKIISSIKYRSLWEPKGSNNEIGTIENRIFYCHEKQETSEAIAKAMEKQSIFITTRSERQRYVDQVTRISEPDTALRGRSPLSDISSANITRCNQTALRKQASESHSVTSCAAVKALQQVKL